MVKVMVRVMVRVSVIYHRDRVITGANGRCRLWSSLTNANGFMRTQIGAHVYCTFKVSKFKMCHFLGDLLFYIIVQVKSINIHRVRKEAYSKVLRFQMTPFENNYGVRH